MGRRGVGEAAVRGINAASSSGVKAGNSLSEKRGRQSLERERRNLKCEVISTQRRDFEEKRSKLHALQTLARGPVAQEFREVFPRKQFFLRRETVPERFGHA